MKNHSLSDKHERDQRNKYVAIVFTLITLLASIVAVIKYENIWWICTSIIPACFAVYYSHLYRENKYHSNVGDYDKIT